VNCADVRSMIGGYVLQALEPEEAAAVRAHVDSCPDCAREHAELAAIPALLDAAHDPDAAPAQPPAALEEAVLGRFAEERRPRRRGGRLRAPRWLARPLPAAALAAACAAAITFAATSAFEDGDGGDAPKVYGAHLHAAAGGAPGQGTGSAPTGGDEPYAYAKLSKAPSGTRVELKASGLDTAASAVYELWCIYPDGSRVSGGTFRADATGRARATMTTAARVGDYHRLSVERRGPGRRGERVLAGDISY
jgi:anti-sigma-K factor RskA